MIFSPALNPEVINTMRLLSRPGDLCSTALQGPAHTRPCRPAHVPLPGWALPIIGKMIHHDLGLTAHAGTQIGGGIRIHLDLRCCTP